AEGRYALGSPGAFDALAAVQSAAAAVDGTAIQAATQVVAAAAQQALPGLRAWARNSAPPDLPQAAVLRALLERDTPERVASLDPIDRLAVAQDALRAAAAM